MRSRWRTVIDEKLQFHPDGGGLHASVYLISDQDRFCLIDPSIEPERLPDHFEINTLILTHAHADHFWAVDRYREKEDIPLYIHAADQAQLVDPLTNGARFFGQDFAPQAASHLVHDEDVIPLGETLELLVIATPGHTKGSACFLLRQINDQRPLALITGDTLFRSSMGRTDLPSGSEQEMEMSLRALVALFKTLPDDLPILPGHGPLTTCGRELRYNPFLQAL